MPLSPKQLAGVTLGEFEEMARRFGAALSVLKDAQGMLGGAAQAAPVRVASPLAQAAPVAIQQMSRADAEAAAPDPDGWRAGLNSEQQAFLEEKRMTGERAKLLETMRGG